LLGHGVHSSLENEEQYYVESKGTPHSSIHIYNKSRTLHEKNREDANLTYESLVNLEEYHSKFIMEKSKSLHISKRHRGGQQCACDRQQPVINWRNPWTGILKKQLVSKKPQIISRLSLNLTSGVKHSQLFDIIIMVMRKSTIFFLCYQARPKALSMYMIDHSFV
jgi:hypothetical protein